MTEIIKVNSKHQLRVFIDLPNRLYKNDPNYVPSLYVSLKSMFDRTSYPFFTRSEADLFLAFKNKKPAGRIAAIQNNNHIAYTGERCGFFGFFETIDDYEVAKALIDNVIRWCLDRRLDRIVGPENFTTNDSVGFLTQGFDSPPVFMMPYNKPYYNDFFERYGFRKKLDLSSYYIPSNAAPEKLIRVIQKIEGRLKEKSITIRPLNMKDFDKEMVRFRVTYNESYKDNWGFIPLEKDEFRHQSEELRKIADPNLILIAEKDGKLIAFVCAIPDINQVLIKIRNGRLFPFGLFKLFKYKKKITNLRVLILGVLDEYRGQGIDAVLYNRLFEYSRDHHINGGEAAYVMENNTRMIRVLNDLGGQVRKKYRLYEYDIRDQLPLYSIRMVSG
jgi:GNAT superfamily N-acetyltransferase